MFSKDVPFTVKFTLKGLNLETPKKKQNKPQISSSRNHFTVYNDDDQGIERIFLWHYPQILQNGEWKWNCTTFKGFEFILEDIYNEQLIIKKALFRQPWLLLSAL
jgi:uncharacterized circularly permuted ATP-grasp superfamily protein